MGMFAPTVLCSITDCGADCGIRLMLRVIKEKSENNLLSRQFPD